VLRNFDRSRRTGESSSDLWRTGVPRPSRDCFADEVAIDFPSSGVVIDRLRASYGESGEALPVPAEIVLTPGQARQGVVVPLQVLIPCPCARCGGRGETWMEGCVTCVGTGAALVPHQVRITLPPQTRHGSRFRFSIAGASPQTVVEVHIAVV
jgi:hypothetical protein